VPGLAGLLVQTVAPCSTMLLNISTASCGLVLNSIFSGNLHFFGCPFDDRSEIDLAAFGNIGNYINLISFHGQTPNNNGHKYVHPMGERSKTTNYGIKWGMSSDYNR